ncbi:EF-hand domain-containing protein [Streptomyces sp. R302]|uniref:EF-hand domain-containing protein n=1 Tax=unclassified Streptomyces TaxID=2593676 RepID=UPI00145FA522|nr:MULTISPECIES: EF-hand domain-containing protein [unclassified Streptomyces]NML54623.1 EF-hand domain-containing protein [Streptomyces sp. R301]NML82580.1 EF-hand domain-containing protein [Streptomyces sp. R302]
MSIVQDRLEKRFAKWDTDGNGTLEAADFDTEAAKIASAFGSDISSPKGVQLRNGFEAMFQYIAKGAGSVSQEQFLTVGDEIVADPASFNRVLGPVVKGIVALADKDDDGSIDAAEFATWLRAIGLGEKEGREAFQEIDTNKNGSLSEDELLDAVRRFHTGELDVELLG